MGELRQQVFDRDLLYLAYGGGAGGDVEASVHHAKQLPHEVDPPPILKSAAGDLGASARRCLPVPLRLIELSQQLRSIPGYGRERVESHRLKH
jgi:hypothetical protein